MNRLMVSIFWVLLTFLSLSPAQALESSWPRTLPLEQGMVTIYSPQVDRMSDNTIHFRAALAYRATADSEPVFGAAWFESPVEIDSANRIVHPTHLKVIETRFPTGTFDLQSDLSTAVAWQSPNWNMDFSLDELEAALKTNEAESRAVQNLNTAPPQIIYRDHPALLVSMDGEPILREIENSTYKAVINTPYPLIFNGQHYYLNAAKDVWYRADEATGPYRFEASPPADIATMVNADKSDTTDGQSVENVTAANAPEIIVSTQPAELIVTEGPAAFVPLVDDLLVLQNSDDDVFMHVGSQNFYIVLAGRWYHAGSLNGPWSYQQADELPGAFANIPRDSNQADSRVYVAGTEEAREAVLDAQVPQTAAVKRGEVDIEVEYDGEPVYQPVDGTDMVYIENTGSTVLQANGLYYLVENGVWYVSSSPNGPWQVSDHRPLRVSSILPTSPVYNVKYVHVYDSTPSVVYVGYTPGYTGSYVYHNTIFYGSGWYYRPWVSPYYYYPRHSTWGFNVSYNSWSGWNYGLSWGWGPFSVAYYSGGYWHRNHYWHHRHYGHWGPRGYRPRPVHHGRRGDRYAHNGDRRSGSGRYDRDHNDRDRNARGGDRSDTNVRNDNLYRDDSQRARLADTRDRQARRPGNRNIDARQANNSRANSRRQQNYTGLKNGESNRISPVRSSDLRLKADVRDTNVKAKRGRLLADNNGKVYRGTKRGSDWSATVPRSDRSAKSTKKRSAYSTPDRKKNQSQNSSRSSKRASGKSTGKQTTQPVTGSSSRRSKMRTTDKQTVQRSSSRKNTSVRQSRASSSRKSVRQQQSRVVVTGTQKRNVSRQATKQRSPQSSNRNTAPTRTSGNNRRSNKAPAQKSAQKNTQKTANRSNKSSSSGGKRAGRNRSNNNR